MTTSRPAPGRGQLLVEVAESIAVLTFHHPAKRNALSSGMRAELPGVLEALQADPRVRVVILTGAGEAAFVSGADISEFPQRRTAPAARADYDRVQLAINQAFGHLEKPVIAMIRGFCMGAGLLIALQADIRIAAADGQFGVPAARLGLGYPFAGVTPLVDLVGPAAAAEMLFSARQLAAAEAQQIGLVNRVVPADRLRAEVMGLARQIAQNAPLTVAACKVAIRESGRPAEQRDTRRVEAMIDACFRSADYREGQRAFAEKRPPMFTGR
jgi:enoyl-CoA hydratase